MFDWISGFVARWAGRLQQDILDVVHWTVHAVAGVVYTVFGNVGRAWSGMWQSIHWLWIQASGYVAEVFGWIRQIVTVDLPVIWSTLLADVRGVLGEIGRVWSDLVARIEQLGRYAAGLVQQAIVWVVDHVYSPLKAYADAIYNDLLKWGFYAWRLLNDPPRLAAILLGALIAAAESAFWSIAPPVGRFVLGILLHNGQRFASLLESILTAVL